MAEKAELGRVVSLQYRGGVKGEEPCDIRDEGNPLRVMLGNMMLPRGIEEAVVGMAVGEEKTVEVPCELAYGEYRDELARWYPKGVIPDGYSLELDDMLNYRDENGGVHPAFVADLTEDNVKLDMNHPFAGKDLVYWLKLVSLG